MINQMQRKHLKTRIDKATQAHLGAMWNAPDPKEPADVKKARALVDRWDKQKSARKEAHRDKVRAAARNAEEQLLFAEPKDALAAVKAYEGMKFKAA